MHGCNRDAKKRAYLALVRPHLEFCSPAWTVHQKKDEDAIESVQRKAARWICAHWNPLTYTWSKTYEESCEELKWPTLRQRRRFLSACQTYKIVNDLDCIRFNDYFRYVTSTTRSHDKAIYLG